MADSDPKTERSEEDELYDLYLAAALRGEAEEPAAFCRERGVESSRLLALLTGIHATVAAPGVSAATDGSGLPFERLGEYRLLRPLGEGGMGMVFLAEQESLGRLVAVKVLRPELAASPTAAERFRREARAVARLSHPHIVGVYDFGTEGGVSFLAMECVPGRSLAEVLSSAAAGEPLPAIRIVRWVAEIADALAAAHAAGVVHRDVKPSNIRIASDGKAMLLDFGLARQLDGAEVTLTTSFAGSPSYAAPEQIDSGRGAIGPATDVYGLGAVLYEALGGRPPFEEASVQRLLRCILLDEPARLRRLRAQISLDLEVVAARALEKEPADRYASAEAMAADLRAVLELRPIQARPPGPWRRAQRWAQRHRATAAAVLAVVGVLIVGGLVSRIRGEVERSALRGEARELVADARGLLEDYEAERSAAASARIEIGKLQSESARRHLRPAELERRWRLQAEEDTYAKSKGLVYAQVFENLTRAAQLDPRNEELGDTLAMYYHQRFLDLRDHEDLGRMKAFEDAVKRNDDSGQWTDRVTGKAVLSIASEPPGAEVHLFQVRPLQELAPGAEHRWVPWTDELSNDLRAPAPGVEALVVVEGAGEVLSGDVILEVDGRPVGESLAGSAATSGVTSAVVWRDGERVELDVPAGLRTRRTAAPLLPGPASHYGTTPIDPHRVDPGAYVAILRKEGFEDLRLSFHVDHAVELYSEDLSLNAELLPRGATPRGFVRVAVGAYGWGEPSFWIQAYEVTCGAYLEFLNAVASEPPRYPLLGRDGSTGVTQPWPERHGRFVLPEGVDAEWPVLGVSWDEAVAYADWLSARDGRRYSLPTFQQWNWAAFGGDWRDYVFGERFSPSFAKSRTSSPAITPEPVGSYPVDESPVGVFDLAGSASEWLLSASTGGAAEDRQIAGGSWLDSSWGAFQVKEKRAQPRDARSPAVGFRLMWSGEDE